MILVALLIAAAILAAGVAWSDRISAGIERVEAVLVGAEQPIETDADSQYWTCGMHPWVILPEPGQCPICGMDLVPLDPGKLTGAIAIDPVMVQNIGVRIEPVVTGPLTREVRTVGAVTYNEAAVRNVNTKVAGWIEKLYVDQTGVRIEQGQPLFELYSPELYQAQQEYLLAYRNRDQIGAEFLPQAAQGALDLLEAVRTRLEYFDISDEQIQKLQETGEVLKTLTITSPYTGIVIDKRAAEGMRVEPGMRVYRIADLSTVWVQATVYEHQLPYVETGQKAVMTLPYLPGEVFEGEVAYIYPYLNEQTRAVKVRLEFPNPEGLLKPGMYATVHLQSTLDPQAVLAPREAVIGTGEREIVFVSLGEGRFEPREVETGVQTGDGTILILDGVRSGEMIVTSGQFLLDSESKMRSALAKMVDGNLASEQEPVAPVAEADKQTSLPHALAQRLTAVLNSYFQIGDALAQDTLEGVEPTAEQLARTVGMLANVEIPQQPRFWAQQQEEIQILRQQAVKLAEVSDLKPARETYAAISNALNNILQATGVPSSYGKSVHRFVCNYGWVQKTPGHGIWLQVSSDPRNPYMGAASGMLACNIPDKHRVLPVADRAVDDTAE